MLNLYANRDAVAAAVPSPFKVSADALVPVYVTLDHCASAVLENETLQKEVDILWAGVDVEVDNPPTGPERQEFLLDYSSSWTLMDSTARQSKVAGDLISVAHAATPTGEDVQVQGRATQYKFSLPPTPFAQVEGIGQDFRFWGGTSDQFRMTYSLVPGLSDQIGMACTVDLTSGPLARIFSDVTPCQAFHQDSTSTINLEHEATS